MLGSLTFACPGVEYMRIQTQVQTKPIAPVRKKTQRQP